VAKCSALAARRIEPLFALASDLTVKNLFSERNLLEEKQNFFESNEVDEDKAAAAPIV
jgi:hypothetical protein